MFSDPKPLSIYGETQGWKMPGTEPISTLKRPPYIKATSSSSSLRGMEQAIPSFQDFLSRTPPPDHTKPLPPTPLRPRRPSSFDSASSRPSSRLTRRSSSIYSRATSQWNLEPEVPPIPTWQTADFADQDLLLRPIAYSASTPHLAEVRTYSPLINTPSPTISRRTTPSPPPRPRPSVLLPPPAGFVQVPKKHLRMVSLEKAKELLQASGAIHLLPEELRAQAIGRSHSQDPMRITSMELMSGRMTPPELPEAPTLVDHQGRERLLSSPRMSLSSVAHPDYLFSPQMSPVASSFNVGSGPSRTMAPISNQMREASRMRAAQALGPGNADDQRGRVRERGPRDMSYEHYMPHQTSKTAIAPTDTLQTDAQMIAQEYHLLLSEQYRQPSFSSTSQQSTRSDIEVATHMKMVPQPLFHSKPAAKLHGSPSGRSSTTSISPFGMRVDSGTSFGERRRSSGGRGFFPLRLSLSSASGRKRRSTSGSIPISPPSVLLQEPHTAPTQSLAKHQKQPSKVRRMSDDNRVSAYYPHVMSRKKGKGKKEKGSSQAPDMPLLAADIIAQRLMTPIGTPEGSPLNSIPPWIGTTDHSDIASLHSNKSSRRLPHRILKGATKYADKFTRPSESPAKRHEEAQNPVPSPESPHLLPSPSSAKQPPAVHLGWSDVAKNAFDEAGSSMQPSRRQPEPVITHMLIPARPLDESRDGLAEPESPRRKNSIFGGLMDGWRENQAEKRRADLKKLIKVVTPETRDEEMQGVGQKRASLVSRRYSAYNWM